MMSKRFLGQNIYEGLVHENSMSLPTVAWNCGMIHESSKNAAYGDTVEVAVHSLSFARTELFDSQSISIHS